MIEEFVAASKHLNEALGRYVGACTNIHSSCVRGNWLQLNSALRELSDRVANELLLVTAYENKLKTARLAISQARNCCATLAPIHSLPDELLAHIFYLVLSAEPCTSEDSESESEDALFPKYPDLLSHVCSRWRGVSTSSRALWSHIDLAPCSRFHQGLVNRAEMCAIRAGDLPLYVHVISSQYQLDWTEANSTFEQFLESMSARIKSLELLANDPSDAEDTLIDLHILDSCLQKCQPGVLSELSITDHLGSPDFIWPSGRDPEVDNGLHLISPYEFLENLWHHVTVLRLYGVYPYWTSKAYHGLVELRLTALGNGDISISEQQLVAILSSSPQLRSLHFDIDITDQLPENASVTPVCLSVLQIASFTFGNSDQARRLLRWLTPGSMSLQLSIVIRSRMGEFLLNDNTKGFFTRSIITRLRLLGFHISYQEVVEFLGQLPCLRVFALEDCICWLNPEQVDTPKHHPEEHNETSVPSCLERLYMLRCHNGLDGLRWMVEKRFAHTLTLWDCTLVQDMETKTASIIQVDEILKSSPVVEFITGGKPNPSNDWD